MEFKEFLMTKYSLGEKSANDYVGRMNGILARGIYKGELEITPTIEAAIIKEYPNPNSKGHYFLALERFIEFQQKK